jgi:hypothetical protein
LQEIEEYDTEFIASFVEVVWFRHSRLTHSIAVLLSLLVSSREDSGWKIVPMVQLRAEKFLQMYTVIHFRTVVVSLH